MLLWAAAVLCLAVPAFASEKEPRVDYTGFEVVTARFTTQEQVDFILKLREEHPVELWNEPHIRGGFTMIQIPPGLAPEIIDLLAKQGIEIEIAFEDLQKAILEERRANAPISPEYYSILRSVSTFDLSKYHTLDAIYSFLQDVANEYPQLAEVITIGNSYENRPIKGIRISAAAKGTRPVIFLEFGIHAREWVSPATALYIIKELTASTRTSAATMRLISNYEFVIIPSANPDGYVYTYTRDRAWRKTRSKSRVSPTCIGADPNRNFDVHFCGAGSSRTPCSSQYCGDSAFSEKETQALKNISLAIGARMQMYIAVHSFSQLWMYPYGYSTKLPPNAAKLNAIGRAGVNALTSVYGTRYKLGPIATTIYEASGSSIDWVYDVVGCKTTFALELRDTGYYGFLLPPSLILPTAQETWTGVKAAIGAL